ncbi:MAG: exodeoxyribonuclease VII large subunit [Cellvibrionaceae bacterium]|jgi:exodeoxyribonuclease VII large subunit
MLIRNEKTILSVGQLNRKVKQLLETHLPLIWVSGELSNFVQPASGHWYFSLKDDGAQVRCAMFKNATQHVRRPPRSGQQVLARARVSVYEKRGEFQLIVEHMEEAGIGALQQAYEVLKAKLLEEGLFDQRHKKALPLFPRHIGVITSPSGAAIHDILTVLKRRYPIAQVTIVPVSVQGESAADEMVAALEKAKRYAQFDCLIIGRGGGSLEDLWAFNNEALARAIYACSIPIISAVGHEVDFTICDFVADVRAPTPSASAEMAAVDLSEWRQIIDDWQQKISRHTSTIVNARLRELSHLRQRLRHPGEAIGHQRLRVQKLRMALIHNLSASLSRHRQLLVEKTNRLDQQHPRYAIQQRQQYCRELQRRLQKTMQVQLASKRQLFLSHGQLLDAVSPLAILDRGYSIASNTDGRILRRVEEVAEGDQVTTRLSNGHFDSKVIVVKHD